jgi:hypothetical protein
MTRTKGERGGGRTATINTMGKRRRTQGWKNTNSIERTKKE